jgi:hypothetical protein
MSFENFSINGESTSNNEYLIDFNSYLELSSFEYIPKKFLDINTSTFGSTTKNSFLELKQKILLDSTSFEDKCQGVRYLCHIPYLNALEHCLECCKNILENDSYDLSQRFYFFSNNEKYFKLEDHLVFNCYKLFFDLCLERNYPYYFTLLCCKYMIQNVPEKSYIFRAKQFLYDISADQNETIQSRAESIDTLLEYGNLSDRDYANKQLETLGDNYVENLKMNIYTNTQNIHNETIQLSIRNMLRNLIKENYKIKHEKEYHIEDIHNWILKYSTMLNKDSEKYIKILNRLLTDPSKYEGYTLSDILLLVWKRIYTFNIDTIETLQKRFFEELDDMDETCSSGHLSRILNILSGFIKDEEYQLKINPKDSLKSAIFARLNSQLRKLGIKEQEEILEALASNKKEDKFILEEYITYYSPKEELEEEYKGLLKEEEFNSIYELTIKEYMGL